MTREMHKMTERVVIITGGAQGIGYELAQKFYTAGDKVVLVDLHEEVAAAAKKLGERAIGIVCDVTNEEKIKDMVAQVMSEFGHIDVLINNAGLQHVAMIEEFPTEKFQLLIDVMLVAPFVMTKHVLPHMKKQQSGRILNMSSINGVIGFAGKAAYNSAKHGVIGFTKVAALETAAHGITVNAICPGYADTELVRNQFDDLAKTRGISREAVLEDVLYPLIPQKRLIDLSEIADTAFFLASDSAKGMTGQAIIIDGGYTAQ